MSEHQNTTVVPPLKWAGGKRWLVPRIMGCLPRFERYIEPFLGGGSVFFSIRPANAIINDSNTKLIETYQEISRNWKLVWRYLRQHQNAHSDAYYYQLRQRIYQSPSRRAAQFIYLNRTCWNGLFRVNKAGVFNVPRGTKDSVILPTDNFHALSAALRRAEIVCGDFESTIDRACKGDFVFVDPPYTVAHKNNGFLKYNQELFSWEDQLRLRECIGDAVTRGAKVFVCNADHESVRSLYADFSIESINRQSVIAGSSKYRGRASELIIKCW